MGGGWGGGSHVACAWATRGEREGAVGLSSIALLLGEEGQISLFFHVNSHV